MKKDQFFFSIILPVYKEPWKVLSKCLDSIQNQSFRNYELIIIIDNPDFHFFNEIKNEIKNEIEFKIIKNKENLGITKSLNIGIKNAKGKYIVRQDADDYSLPDRLMNAHTVLNINRKISIYTSPARVNGILKPNYFVRKFFTEEILKFKNVLFHGTLIIRRNLILKNLYNENYKYSQDYELYNRLMSQDIKIFYDDNNLTYVSNPSVHSISAVNFEEQTTLFNRVVDSNGYGWTRFKLIKIFRLDLLIVLYMIFKRIIYNFFFLTK